MKAQVDEFAFILLAGLILIGVFLVVWTSQASTQITVLPDSKDLTIARGSSSSFYIFISGTAYNVTLRSSGKIASWISFERDRINVEKEERVKVYVDVPISASYGTYWGEIYVETLGFQKIIPISVNVSTRTEEKIIPFSFDDFNVGYIVGEEIVEERENFKVEKGYFSEFSSSFAAIIPEEKLPLISNAYLQIVIDQTNSLGNLIVEFNDNKTFDKKVGVGEVILKIPKESIRRSNSIVLKAGVPGFVFWSNSFYKIASARFVVEYNGTIFREFNFSLEEFEVKNFKEGKISLFAKSYEIVLPPKLSILTIKINDKTIYNNVPPYYLVKKFGNDVELKAGTNTISFSTEKGGSYLLEDVTLEISQY
ncbi:MAG: hypothetical protein QW423_01050 [Candidatus Aenigmatarchaeota archaeon]